MVYVLSENAGRRSTNCTFDVKIDPCIIASKEEYSHRVFQVVHLLLETYGKNNFITKPDIEIDRYGKRLTMSPLEFANGFGS